MSCVCQPLLITLYVYGNILDVCPTWQPLAKVAVEALKCGQMCLRNWSFISLYLNSQESSALWPEKVCTRVPELVWQGGGTLNTHWEAASESRAPGRFALGRRCAEALWHAACQLLGASTDGDAKRIPRNFPEIPAFFPIESCCLLVNCFISFHHLLSGCCAQSSAEDRPSVKSSSSQPDCSV